MCHLDEVNCDFAYCYAVAVGEAIGIVDARLVDHYAVAAGQVAYVEAVRAGNDLGMQAGGRYFGEYKIIRLISPQRETLPLS